MNIEVKIIKGIPTEQIEKFEDRVVYNLAVLTREETKGLNSYPVRTGELMRQEVAQAILGSNKEYGLSAGVDYAKYVWKFENVKWTNKSTLPHWYYSVFNKNGAMITHNSVERALKEIK